MASKKIVLKPKSKLAVLVNGKKKPCAFCMREIDDEATYGKLYAIGDIQVHYFCVLLSCCLVQKGKDSEGLFGFLYHDIIAEVERSKKHKCSYCNKEGASMGCSVSQCRKQFHLPCGRERNVVSLFYGNYKSFCVKHAPKQKIPEHIMALARLRMKKARNALNFSTLKELCANNTNESCVESESVCVICYEAVDGFPGAGSFWPPCCARDAWFHRTCLQRMALSAGMHYLKCPLCNDKDQFYDAVVSQGIYVPDRDAAWELEQNAFAEIYERPSVCSAEECQCPMGRNHDADSGEWNIQLCILCGTVGRHSSCLLSGPGMNPCGRFVCQVCAACAPADLDQLAAKVDSVILAEQQQQSRQNARRAVMPSRMSLRRTKARISYNNPSTSRNNSECAGAQIESGPDAEGNRRETRSGTFVAREELNLKPPKRRSTEHPTILKTIENTMFSPTKALLEGITQKMRGLGADKVGDDSEQIINKIKKKLMKPRPLSVKKQIVNSALKELFDDIPNQNQKPQDWRSPDRTNEIAKEVPEITVKLNKETTEDKQTVLPDNDTKLTNSSEKLPLAEENDENSNKKSPLNVDDIDESSSSTFQLPSEFVADRNSDDSLTLFDNIETPKKLTMVDIQKDSSLEISENNEKLHIDVVKIEEKNETNTLFESLKLKIPLKKEKCAFKFNPLDKEVLEENKLDMDVESFKNYYLNEIGKDFKCTFNHKHTNIAECHKTKLRSAIDFALEATKEKSNLDKRTKLKRKLKNKNGVPKKRAKKDKEIVLKYNNRNDNNIEVVCSNDDENMTESIDLTVKTPKTKRKLKKFKKNKKIRENIQVKIRFRKQQVNLKITKTQTKNKNIKDKKLKSPLDSSKKLKQCILQCSSNVSPNDIIVKPDHDVTPKKRNYIKLEKSPDTMVQTSIQSFFKKVTTQQTESN